MQYRVVEAKDAKRLTEAVSKLIDEEGWRPQGSVSIWRGSDLFLGSDILVQALVKDQE